MEKLLKPNGSLNRREFLEACGQVVVVSASYEAVSLVLGDAKAHAASLNTNVADDMLDASLPNAPIFGNEIQADVVTKGVREDAEALKNRIKRKFETRTPSAICGVRG